MRNKFHHKMISKAVIIFILVINAAAVFSQVKLLHDVTVIDGTGKAPKNHQDVLISGDRILSITPATAKIPAGAEVIHLEGKIVMPLLIDAHAHLGLLK